jgi:hypothetical protein
MGQTATPSFHKILNQLFMEIVNKVAQSNLIVLDVKTLRPTGARKTIDLASWLEEGLLLREKAFRDLVATHDWTQFQNAFVNITCSTDAIIPSWAYMLFASALQPHAKGVFVGSKRDMEGNLLLQTIEQLDLEPYKEKPIIINGCSDPDIPETAFAQLTFKLQPVAKRIMFGEACSTVPVYKK